MWPEVARSSRRRITADPRSPKSKRSGIMRAIASADKPTVVRITEPLWFRAAAVVVVVGGAAGLVASGPLGLVAVPFVLVFGWRAAQARVTATPAGVEVRNFFRTYRISASNVIGYQMLGGQVGVRTADGRTIICDAAKSASLRTATRERYAQETVRRLVEAQHPG